MASQPICVLEDFAQLAYDFSINLDGRVERRPDCCCRGGNAIVYKGSLLPDGVEVAVKIPCSNLPADETRKIIKDIVREVHAWSKLCHKNVLSLLGITTEFDRTISLVSVWMENGNAHDYVQDKEVDPRPLIEGIARGLHYLHDYKPGSNFHGDLKGSNVLISQEGNALLTDFGLSYVVDSSLRMSFTTIYGGTLRWMAPEIVGGGEVSAEGDVWAFGMTALELFTRKVPFHECQGPGAIVYTILRALPARPGEEETFFRLTDNWWEMCASCWNRQPFLRPQMSALVKSIYPKARSVTAIGNPILGISGIEVRNANEVSSAELTIGGQHYRISSQREGNILREDFGPPVESPLQDQFSLSIISSGSGFTERIDLSFDALDVYIKSEQYTFRKAHKHLEIVLKISPSAELVPPELLIPTTDELLRICPHFRILIIGKTGVGKTSLINRTFGVDEARPAHDKRGKANIEKPLVSKRNKRFILHDSLGFEPGENNNIAIVQSFIERRKNHKDVKEQLHAIWLCFQIPIDAYGQRMMETGMEKFLRMKKTILGDIPTVFVFTKYDKLVDEIEIRWEEEGREYVESDVEVAAAEYLKKHCVECIERLTGEHDIPYLAVSTRARYQDKLKQLVQLTYQKVSEHFAQQQGTGPSAVSTVTVMAQRVVPSLNITASIEVGKQRYWQAVFSVGNDFSGHKIQDCLGVIHTDIVKVWNLCDPSEVLMGEEFRASIFNLVDLLEDNNRSSDPSQIPQYATTAQSSGGFAQMVMRALVWAYQIYTKAPEVQRKFMAYIVDLTHVMDLLFMLTVGKDEQELKPSIIKDTVLAYIESAKRRNGHTKIKAFTGSIIGYGGDVFSEIKFLVTTGCDGDEELGRSIENIANAGKKLQGRMY